MPIMIGIIIIIIIIILITIIIIIIMIIIMMLLLVLLHCGTKLQSRAVAHARARHAALRETIRNMLQAPCCYYFEIEIYIRYSLQALCLLISTLR